VRHGDAMEQNMKSTYRTVTHDGVHYAVLILGGFGWSLGCRSVLKTLDGNAAGQLIRADIGAGPLSHSQVIDADRDLPDHEKRLLTLGRTVRSTPPTPEYE